MRRLFAAGAALSVVLLAFACGGGKLAGGPGDGGNGQDGGGSGSSSGGGSGADAAARPPSAPATKLDVLFMIENANSMASVTIGNDFLTASIPPFFHRLLNPNCVDASGNVLGESQGGQCASGQPEFQPVHDIHVGVVTSSLGGFGGDQCPENATNPSAPGLSAHTDDHGELITRSGVQGTPNLENPASPIVSYQSESQLVSDVQGLVLGANVHGCGFRASLESFYRFLIQPDPYATIDAGPNGTRTLDGVDATIIQQRHGFLRPDSALAVILVVSKDDQGFDTLSIGAQGWAFSNTAFPGSPNMAAPEGTVACQSDPESPQCTSCAFIKTSPSFATQCPNDPPGGVGGYLDPSDDALRVRAFHTKQRFGLEPQFPIDRYVSGLTSYAVPDQAHEHDTMGNYAPVADCANPIFSTGLPSDPSSDLCHLAPGPRRPSQVFLTVIGGVPHQLLQVDPTNPDSPQKTTLAPSDWTRVLGADPLHYDFTGSDFHMIQSEQDRTTMTTDPSSPTWANHSNCPDSSSDTCDPISGREFATNKSDLQFACIFPLANVMDCTSPGPGDAYKGACACATGGGDANSQLCQKGASGYTQVWINGFAQPAIRQLSVARALGPQAVVGSLCPIHTAEATPGDPLYAFRPPLQSLIDRLSTALAK
jgi:hypothetical protein